MCNEETVVRTRWGDIFVVETKSIRSERTRERRRYINWLRNERHPISLQRDGNRRNRKKKVQEKTVTRRSMPTDGFSYLPGAGIHGLARFERGRPQDTYTQYQHDIRPRGGKTGSEESTAATSETHSDSKIERTIGDR